jgi:hypothetical protein
MPDAIPLIAPVIAWLHEFACRSASVSVRPPDLHYDNAIFSSGWQPVAIQNIPNLPNFQVRNHLHKFLTQNALFQSLIVPSGTTYQFSVLRAWVQCFHPDEHAARIDF